jgi:propionyl-CoA carboxylase alpha chain
MFSKILVANRGEVACRIIRSARRMGMASVAVYSDVDVDGLHVEMADEAVHIGAAPAADSYLRIDRIVAACRDTGAEAVHPGFGFLSENATFVEALDQAGITFVGPPAAAIRAMGDKIESKRLAAEAGVNTVPGHMGLVENTEHAVEIARGIGYPVMIKASAGGGGKGMRIARSDDEAAGGFESARSEARSSFGDDRMFIEKFVEEPRHIEIQVLADSQGHTIHLGERECSIQRRHQKVIEESPSPFLDTETRSAMGAQAVALANAVGYVSAGTVEFIVDKHRDFYFLEMNTRLQVEHPVTEMVTGLDLVELMFRIAAGEPLPLGQEDVALTGWAIETRVYAEDPSRGFLPSIGRLVRYREPAPGPDVRVDSGVVEGSEISMYYDPMIAKLITHGADRNGTIETMREALDRFYVRGIDHNMAFLSHVIDHPRFRAGRLTTGFIAEEYPDGLSAELLQPDEPLPYLAVASLAQRRMAERECGISGQIPGRARQVAQDWVVLLNGRSDPVCIKPTPGGIELGLDDGVHRLESDWQLGEALFHGRLDGRALRFQVDRFGVGWQLSHGGRAAHVLVLTARAAALAAQMPVKEPPDLSGFLLSPMPGLLVSVAVEVGQQVKTGEQLAVVEAMKMENVLRATRDGVVAAIHTEPGASLAVDQPILEFE